MGLRNVYGAKVRLDYKKVELFVKNTEDTKVSNIRSEFSASKSIVL